jgi:hypothetical protein
MVVLKIGGGITTSLLSVHIIEGKSCCMSLLFLYFLTTNPILILQGGYMCYQLYTELMLCLNTELMTTTNSNSFIIIGAVVGALLAVIALIVLVVVITFMAKRRAEGKKASWDIPRSIENEVPRQHPPESELVYNVAYVGNGGRGSTGNVYMEYATPTTAGRGNDINIIEDAEGYVIPD